MRGASSGADGSVDRTLRARCQRRRCTGGSVRKGQCGAARKNGGAWSSRAAAASIDPAPSLPMRRTTALLTALVARAAADEAICSHAPDFGLEGCPTFVFPRALDAVQVAEAARAAAPKSPPRRDDARLG